MSAPIRAWAAAGPGQPLRPFEYDPGPLRPDHVEIAVDWCGICHSDLSMLHNHWGMTAWPFVPGHEAVGRVVAVGSDVTTHKVGTVAGLGWHAASCRTCRHCLSGDQNLCASGEGVIVGRHGAFADRVRVQAAWAVPLPAGLDPAKAGPLFCGGITVFNPLLQLGIRPVDRVGVIGIGGLGHMALMFLRKWGCEVTAFTSSESKRAEAESLGAHHVINSRDDGKLAAARGSLDVILSTVNVTMNWPAFVECLAPRGKLHVVGAVLEPLSLPAMPFIMAQRSLTASPVGSPVSLALMLDFAARHGIAPVTETFPMSGVNDAFARLESGKARYRIVLRNDFAR